MAASKAILYESIRGSEPNTYELIFNSSEHDYFVYQHGYIKGHSLSTEERDEGSLVAILRKSSRARRE